MSNADNKEISQILQILLATGISTYLGCINIDKKRRTQHNYGEVKRGIGQKLTGWKTRILFAAGKVILIKCNLTGIRNTLRID